MLAQHPDDGHVVLDGGALVPQEQFLRDPRLDAHVDLLQAAAHHQVEQVVVLRRVVPVLRAHADVVEDVEAAVEDALGDGADPLLAHPAAVGVLEGGVDEVQGAEMVFAHEVFDLVHHRFGAAAAPRLAGLHPVAQVGRGAEGAAGDAAAAGADPDVLQLVAVRPELVACGVREDVEVVHQGAGRVLPQFPVRPAVGDAGAVLDALAQREALHQVQDERLPLAHGDQVGVRVAAQDVLAGEGAGRAAAGDDDLREPPRMASENSRQLGTLRLISVKQTRSGPNPTISSTASWWLPCSTSRISQVKPTCRRTAAM